jgi:RNA polymerase sigma-70 factor, ECF subfamily
MSAVEHSTALLVISTRDDARLLDVAKVHELHADFVWRSLQRLGTPSPELEDAFQEVFMVVQRRLGAFDYSAKVSTWLFAICARVAAAHRRRSLFRSSRWAEQEADMLPAASDEQPDDLLAATQARRTVVQILDRMDPKKRAVFVMFEIEELPSEEIARMLEVPVGTVFSRLHAARKQFQSILRRLEMPPGGHR